MKFQNTGIKNHSKQKEQNRSLKRPGIRTASTEHRQLEESARPRRAGEDIPSLELDPPRASIQLEGEEYKQV